MNTNCNLIKSKLLSFKKSLGAFFNLLFNISITIFKTNTLTQQVKVLLYRPNLVSLFALFLLVGLNSNTLFAQNPGQASNFSIKGEFYSGAFNSVSDDWYQGVSGLGMIDESQTAAFLAITNSLSNTIFDTRSPYGQYEIVNGYLLYDAIYARDYVDLGSSSEKTVFLSSAKNGDNPTTGWTTGAGGVSDKNDIVDVYASLRREGNLITDDMWLTLAGTTMGNTGSHFVDFELYKEDLELNATGTAFINSGPLATGGHSAWVFDGAGNVTSTGDLVAGFEFINENVAGVEIRIWTARANWGTNGTDGLVPFPAGFTWGPQFDGAGNGSTYGYAQIIIPVGSSYDSGSSTSTLGPPWKTIFNGTSVLNYQPGSFAEVGLNLSAIGLDPALPSGNACEAPFKKILIKSRTAAAFTSSLKDFVGPTSFIGAPLVDTTIKVEDPGHFLCEATQLTLSPLNPYPGAEYVYSTLNGLFLDGTQEYIGENAIITTPGTYKLTGAPVSGCTETFSEVTVYAQPCAVDDDMGEIIENGPGIEIFVTFNDDDRDDDIDKTTLNNNTPLLQPSGGTLIINSGNGKIAYIPNPDFYGPDSFEYQICDDQGYCDIALVTVMVLQDSDNDGTGDIYDLDNDNDGIPDTIECAVVAKPRILNSDFEAIDIVTSGLDDGPTDVVSTLPGIWKGDASNIPNWESTDTSNHLEIWNNSHNLRNGAGHDRDGQAYSGRQWAEVNASSNNGLYQDIITTPGDVLQWSFAHRKREGYRNSALEDIVSLEIGAPGSPVNQGNFTSHKFSYWTKHTGTYTVPPGQTITRLNFAWVQSASGNAFSGNFIDAVELSFVDTDCADSDGDGVPNNLDLDADNDGIPDVLEAGFTDANNDGLVDTISYGINGLADEVETFADSGILAVYPINTDEATDIAFGMYDFVDVDSDNDGITDTQEAFSDNAMYNDADNDGQIDGYFDLDINGWQDTIDAEPTFPVRRNSDSDTIPDYLDLDSDNDGIPDTLEGNFEVPDADNNGIVGDGIPNDDDYDGLADTNDPDFTGNVLSGVGFYKDTDGDGLNNTIDIDADNDGIIDNTEGSSTFAYFPPSGIDTDGDGLDDAYDVDNGGNAIGYVNIDGGLYPDYLDVDSEEDGIKDIRENNIANTADADVLDLDNDGMVDPSKFVDDDNDGLANIFDLINGKTNALNATNNNQTPNTQPDDDPQNPGGDRDWREWYGQDTDLDLIPDYLDLDDDNDGILDTVEESAIDTDIDNDGIPNLLDLDSDGDGIPDHTDAGGTFDADGSGMPGSGVLDTTEVDANGVPLLVGPTGITPQDADGDGLPNYLDLDSDNDGIADVIEAGGTDANGDGLYGPGTANDMDSDGIADAVDLFDNAQGNLDVICGGTPLLVPDTDGDTIKNFLDLDSDNDTIPDIVEGQPTIGYVAPLAGFLDTDGDGLNDRFDADNGGTPIVPVDTDSDYKPDYLDLDSDGDFLFDIAEAGAARAAADTSNNGKTNNTVGTNGLDNTFEILDTFVDPNGTLDDTQFDNFPDEDSDVFSGGDVDYRDGGVEDFDGDTVPDAIDLDDDDDGILDTDESYGIDPNADDDSDGISNYLDPDFCTLNAFGICANLDLDNDGIPNHFDLDSDGDGCNDAMEGYNDASVDPDFDGIYGTGVPVVDANGLVISAGVTGSSYNNTPADTDTSTVADFLEDTVFVACLADLSITKTVDNATPQINDIVTFTITILNSGPFSASEITLKDLLPVELTYNAANSTIPASTTYNASTGIWDLSSLTLAVSASIQIEIAAKASSSCSLTVNEAEIISSERFDLDSTPNNGNIAEDDYDTATLTVTDTTPPVFVGTLPVDGTYQCNSIPSPPGPANLTATDNCGSATVTFSQVRTDGSCDSNYTLTRTWTATDCCGANSISHVQTITVIDTTAPTASTTNPLSVQCISTIPAADPSVITGESDNCSTNITVAFLSESNNGGAGTTASPYVLTRIYRVSDDCGNYINVPHQITAIDTTVPIADVASLPDATDECTVTLTAPTATDNCQGSVTGTTTDPTTYNTQGTFTVTWTYDDGKGNTSNQTQTVIIDDITAPVANVATLPNATGECTVTLTAPTATDNCEGTITGTTTDPTTYNTQGTYSVTWTYDDGNTNTSSQTQTVIVDDTTAPLITCAANVAANVDAGQCYATVTLTAPTTSDDCGIASFTNDAPVSGQYPVGTTTVTWTVTDTNGLTNTCTQDVVITDNMPPTITCAADVAANVDTGQCFATVTLTAPTTADNCGVASVTNDAPASGEYPVGTTTVTWTVTDDNGRTATCTQDVVVTDNIDPTITCAADVAANVDPGTCTTDATNVTLGTPTTNDNCSVATVTNDAPTSFPIGDTTVTWTVTDGSGNTATCSQIVTVVDNQDPTFVTCTADVSVNVDAGQCTASSVVLGTPTTNDNCTVATVTNDAPASFPIGDTTVTWTVTDDSGNTATCSQIVTVVDNEIPVFVETPPVDATYECHLVPDAQILTATDNCGDVVVIFTETRTDGTCSSDYSLERIWEVTDANGLITSHTQIITVTDTTAPELTSNLETEINVSCTNIPEVPTLEFEDNCSSNVTVTFEETSTYDENQIANYEIIRTWTVSDACNNEALFVQKLNVQLDNEVVEVSDRACSDNGSINLDNYLSDTNVGSSWTLISGNATLDGAVFDPVNVELGNYTFSYTISMDGCLKTTEVTLEIHDECVVLPCGREDVEISKVITPDGDMYNEYFTVTGVETCGFVVELQIFNRWGAKIYENFNYNNDWNGFVHSSSVGSADKVPNGTYYYIINLRNSGLKPFAKGFFVGTK